MAFFTQVGEFFRQLPEKLRGAAFGRRVFDDRLLMMVVGDPHKGKSTFVDEFLSAVADARSPRLPGDVQITPAPDGERRHVEGFPPATTARVVFTGKLRTGRRSIDLELVDPPGEHARIWPAEADNEDNPDAQAFFASVRSANYLGLALDPADLFELPESERDGLLQRLGYLAAEAARRAADEGKPFHVGVLFTKVDELGVPAVGSVRLVGNRKAELAALRALQTAPDREVHQRLDAFLAAVEADPTASPEGRALRRRLVATSAPLWITLLRCQVIDPRNVNGYLLQSRPVELIDSRHEPWERRGVLHPFADFFDAVGRRNAPAGVRPWMAAAALLLVGIVLGLGIHAMLRYGAISSYTRAYVQNGFQRNPPGVPLDKDFIVDKGLDEPRIGSDLIGKATYIRALNDRYQEMARALAELARRSPERFTRDEARRLLDDMIAAREKFLDWEKVWNSLPEVAQAVHNDPSTGQRAFAEDFKELQRLFVEVEQVMQRFLARTAALARQRDTGVAPENAWRLMEEFERDMTDARARLQAFRKEKLGSVGFLEFIPGMPAKRRSVAEDILAPWCDLAETCVGQALGEAGKYWDYYRERLPGQHVGHLLGRSDAEVAFLKRLFGPGALNPYRRDTFKQLTGRTIYGEEERDWHVGKVFGFVRVRYVNGTEEGLYDINLDTHDVEPVDVKSGALNPLPFYWHLRERVDGSRTWELTMRPGRLELVGIWLRRDKYDTPHPVTVECRGEGNLWLPAVIHGLIRQDRALTIRGLTPEIEAEWKKLLAVLEEMGVPDPYEGFRS